MKIFIRLLDSSKNISNLAETELSKLSVLSMYIIIITNGTKEVSFDNKRDFCHKK